MRDLNIDINYNKPKFMGKKFFSNNFLIKTQVCLNHEALQKKFCSSPFTAFVISSCFLLCLSACDTNNEDSLSSNEDVAIAYLKRQTASLGNPTDALRFTPGGDLFMRAASSPSAEEVNITALVTKGEGDVSDPEVSYDGTKIIFSMRPSIQDHWQLWEYSIAENSLYPILQSNEFDDVDPAYLPDGRIVFSSNRQEKARSLRSDNGEPDYQHRDEYEREKVINLHIFNPADNSIKQISFNQSHDRNPSVLSDGRIMFSRWDHVGRRNQFSIFTTKPDGTGMFIEYGAHSPGNSFLHPREISPGRLVSSLMPLSGTYEGGAIVSIDLKNFTENNDPAPSSTAAAGAQGQTQITPEVNFLSNAVSPNGRYTTPYPVGDGSGRFLVSYSVSRPVQQVSPLTGSEATMESVPHYNLVMLDPSAGTQLPVVIAPEGYAVVDGIVLAPRTKPKTIPDFVDPVALANKEPGFLSVASVYDTDHLERMGNDVTLDPDLDEVVDAATKREIIPTLPNPNTKEKRRRIADIETLKDPARMPPDKRPARFVRITRSVPPPPGLSRETIGETELEMQQILGYSAVEPDGSVKVQVPSDTPLGLAVLDDKGRAFQMHTSWLQVRPGEDRACNGCHSPRRGNPINDNTIRAQHTNSLPGMQPSSSGETMATTRQNVFLGGQPPATHITYTDIWSDDSVPGVSKGTEISITYNGLKGKVSSGGLSAAAILKLERGVINYEEHIQPLWTMERGSINQYVCTRCHNNNDPNDLGFFGSQGLDLRAEKAGSGRLISYQELLIGDPELDAEGNPVFRISDGEISLERRDALVRAGNSVNTGLARGSYLMEKLTEEELRAPQTLNPNGRLVDHSPMMNDSELRLLSEWMDIGAQYFNEPYDDSGAIRGVSPLNEDTFANQVHPILLNRCAACHQPFGASGALNGPSSATSITANRFILTGQVEGDYNMALSMISDTSQADQNYLLLRPSSLPTSPLPHPPVDTTAAILTPILQTSDADYATIRNWVTGG